MIEKIKELSKDTVIYGISTIVGRFLSFLLIPLYTNLFLPDEFGIYTTIYAYLSFLSILYVYGMDAAFMKFTSLAEEREKTDTYSTPFLAVISTTIVLSVILFISRNHILGAIDIPVIYSSIVIYVLFILILDTLALIPFANLRLERKAKKFASIKLMNIFINLALNLYLIVYLRLGIEAIFISNMIASAVTLLILLPDIFSHLKLKINFYYLKKMLWFALPYIPGSLAAMLVQLIDVPIVRALTNDATLGIYRANYKLGIFMMLFVSMFNFAWQPFFLTNAKTENAKEIFSKVLTLTLIVMTALWVILSLFIEDIASFEFYNGKTIIGKDYLVGIGIVPVILLSYIFYGLYVNFTAGIYIKEKTKYFPLVTGSAAVVNVVSNFILVPKYGIMGAAFSTLVSYMVMSAGLFFFSQRFYKINYEYSKIMRIFLLIVLVSVCYYYFYSNKMLYLQVKLFMLFGFFILFFALRIVRKKEIQVILNSFIKKK